MKYEPCSGWAPRKGQPVEIIRWQCPKRALCARYDPANSPHLDAFAHSWCDTHELEGYIRCPVQCVEAGTIPCPSALGSTPRTN